MIYLMIGFFLGYHLNDKLQNSRLSNSNIITDIELTSLLKIKSSAANAIEFIDNPEFEDDSVNIIQVKNILNEAMKNERN